MIPTHRKAVIAAVFLLDGALVYASWIGGYWLRFHALGLQAPRGVPSPELYLRFGVLLAPMALLVMRSLGVYLPDRTATLSGEIRTLLRGVLITAAFAALASYFIRGELSRLVLLTFSTLALVSLSASRVAVRLALRWMRRRGRDLRRVLVVGAGEPARALLRKIACRPDSGLVVAGLVSAGDMGVGVLIEGAPVAGTIEALPEIVERVRADLVYVALARSDHEIERVALERLCDTTAEVRLIPDLGRAFDFGARAEDFHGTPIVLLTAVPVAGWGGVVKRAFDLVVASAALIVLSPLLLVVACWIRLDSPGPVLYAQERVGMNGRRFRMFKFRTMRFDAEEASGPAWPAREDSRRTRAGRLLRRLSLDEFPQLWNVIAGDMSLVGPRPERPVFVEQFRASIPRYMLRHHVRAGMTGWAQVNGLRGDTPLDRRVEYDLHYIRNWSLAFDLRILLLTLLRVFRDVSAR